MFMRSYTSPRPLADEWDWQLSGTCRDTDPRSVLRRHERARLQASEAREFGEAGVRQMPCRAEMPGARHPDRGGTPRNLGGRHDGDRARIVAQSSN